VFGEKILLAHAGGRGSPFQDCCGPIRPSQSVGGPQEGTIRVFRTGGGYLQTRERRLWVGLVVVSVLGLSGSLLITFKATTDLFPPWAAVAASMVVVGSTGTRIVRRLRSVRKGRLGERLVTDLLGSLSDDYCLVNDVLLPQRHGNVDHVLIGPCGVVVIETKRLAGRIRCYADEWSVNGFQRGSISRQVNSGAASIRYYLAARHPDLVPGALRWVESIVVFTHPTCRLEVNRARTVVVRYSELLQVIVDLAKKHHLAPSVASRLAESLIACTAEAA
jgi:nuclease-like protein